METFFSFGGHRKRIRLICTVILLMWIATISSGDTFKKGKKQDKLLPQSLQEQQPWRAQGHFPILVPDRQRVWLRDSTGWHFISLGDSGMEQYTFPQVPRSRYLPAAD